MKDSATTATSAAPNSQQNGTVRPRATKPRTPAPEAEDVRIAAPITNEQARGGARGAIRDALKAAGKTKKPARPAPEPEADDSDEGDEPAPRQTRKTPPKKPEAPAPKPKKAPRREEPEDTETDTDEDGDEAEESTTRDRSGRFKRKPEEPDADDGDEPEAGDENDEVDEGDEPDEETEPRGKKKPKTLEDLLGFDPAQLDGLKPIAQPTTNNAPQGAQAPGTVNPAAPSSATQPPAQQGRTQIPDDWGIPDAQFDELAAYMTPESAQGLRQIQQVVREQDKFLRQYAPVMNWMAERMQVVQREQQRVFQDAATGLLEELRGYGLTTFGKAGEQIGPHHPAHGKLAQLEQTAVMLWDRAGRDPAKAKACLMTAAALVDRDGMEQAMRRQATTKVRESARARQASIDPFLGGRGTKSVAKEASGRDGARAVLRSRNWSQSA